MTTANSNLTAAELKDPATAINFALSRLPAWEVPMFLEDWRDGKDLEPWLWEEEETEAA